MQTELFVAEISYNVHSPHDLSSSQPLHIPTPRVHWPGPSRVLNLLNIYYNYMHHFIFITLYHYWIFFSSLCACTCPYLYTMTICFISMCLLSADAFIYYSRTKYSACFLLLKSRCLMGGTYWVWAARCVTEVFESTFVASKYGDECENWWFHIGPSSEHYIVWQQPGTL